MEKGPLDTNSTLLAPDQNPPVATFGATFFGGRLCRRSLDIRGRGSLPVLPSPFVSSFVPPRVNHQEQESCETQDQQKDGPRLAFPNLLEASVEFRKVHASIIYTTLQPSKREVNGGLWVLCGLIRGLT